MLRTSLRASTKRALPYGIIYVGTCCVTNKQYVGQTTLDAKSRYGYNGRMKEAVERFGKESFVFETIYTAFDAAELDRAEDYFITELNTMEPNGYNARYGGRYGAFPDIVRERISTATKEAMHRPDVAEKQRRGMVNFCADPERLKLRIEKFQDSIKDRPWANNGSENRRFSEGADLPEGWVWGFSGRPGRSKKTWTNHRGDRPHKNVGSKYITDGKQTKRIQPGDALPDGWRYGKAPRSPIRIIVFSD